MSKNTENVSNVEEVVVEEISQLQKLLNESTSKSEVMRKLYDDGKSVSEIAKLLKSHYSFVYGVIQRHCDDSSIEMRKSVKTSKSDEIRKLYDEGLTVGEVAKQLNSNYSFVFSVIKKHREQK